MVEMLKHLADEQILHLGPLEVGRCGPGIIPSWAAEVCGFAADLQGCAFAFPSWKTWQYLFQPDLAFSFITVYEKNTTK